MSRALLVAAALSAPAFAASPSGTWSSGTPLPLHRFAMTTVDAGGILYSFGGNIYADDLTSVLAFDPVGGTFAFKRPMITARNSVFAGVVSTAIYVAGGWTGTARTSVLEVYDTVNDTWSTKTGIPSAMSDGGSAVYNGSLFVLGGAIGGSCVSNSYYYNVAGDSWTTIASMPTPRCHTVAAVIGGKIYVGGGSTTSGVPYTTLEMYDPTTNAWTTKASLQTGRVSAGGFTAGGIFYMVGGYGPTSPAPALATLEAYDPVANTWTYKASIPTARQGFGMALGPDGKGYALLGFGTTVYVTPVEAYDPVANSWSTPFASVPGPRRDAAAVGLSTAVFVFGGQSADGVSDTIQAYAPSSNPWMENTVTQVPMPIHLFGQVAAAFAGQAFLAGGMQTSTAPVANFWEYDWAAGTFTVRAALPAAGGCGAAGVLLGKVYVLTSCDGTAAGVKNLYAYDSLTNTWATMTSAPNVHKSPAFAAIGGKLYVAGGTDGTGAVSNVLDVYDPNANSWTTKTAMPTARGAPAGAALGAYFVVAGGVNGSGTKLGTVEVYDASSDSWSTQASLPTSRSDAAAAVFGGRVLTIGGQAATGDSTAVESFALTLATAPTLASVTPSSAPISLSAQSLAFVGAGLDGTAALTLQKPAIAQASWTATVTLAGSRVNPQIVVLRDGRVLVAGGFIGASATPIASAEVFNPATGVWIGVSTMATARYTGVFALLPDGRVLAAGGRAPGASTAASEIYDPAADSWTPTGAMLQPRDTSVFFTRSDGKIVAVGGVNYNGATATSLSAVEIYDPATGLWTAGNPMSTARTSFAGTVLKDGRFLVSGGSPGSGVLSSAEIYDPTTGNWTTVAAMNVQRYSHRLVTLPDGRVLAAGGATASSGTVSAEVYDPVANTWTPTGSMTDSHLLGIAFLLGERVGVAGGAGLVGPLSSTEFYDRATGNWTTGPTMPASGQYAVGAQLPDGRVLAVGGESGSSGPALPNTEVLSTSWTALAVTGVSVPDSAHASGSVSLLGTATGYYDLAVSQSGGRVGRAPGAFYVALPALATLTPSPAAATLVVGSSRTFTTVGTLTDGTTLPVSASWSSDFGAVTIVGGGLALASSPGVAHLTTSSSSVSAVSTVTVVLPLPTVSAISPTGAATGTLPSPTATGTGFDGTAALSLEAPDLSRSSWTVAGGLHGARIHPMQVTLKDGRVLMAGGFTGVVTSIQSAELFDPATSTWALASSMTASRYSAVFALLPDGRVLASGGRQDLNNAAHSSIAGSEIYDPAVDAWTPTGSMLQPRDTAVWFTRSDGKIVAVGGTNYTGSATNLASVEIYDPATGAWTLGNPMSTARTSFAGTVLKDGRFLVSGGSPGSGVLSSAEIYDPSTGNWTTVASMNVQRYGHTLTTLPDGRVLAAGGATASAATPTAEVYDPVANTWTSVPVMSDSHLLGGNFLVAGRVLVIGGAGASGGLASMDVYDPPSNTWSLGPAMPVSGEYAGFAALADGRLVAAGGVANGYPPGPAFANTSVWSAPWASYGATGLSVPDSQHASGTINLTGAAPGYYDVVVRESSGRVGRLASGFAVASPAHAALALSGAAAGVSSVTWSWSALAGQSGYRVLTSTGGDRSGLISTGTLSWTETGLGPNAATTRELYVFDALGSSATSPTTTVYTRAFPPTGSAATGVFVSSASLSWSLNGDPAATLASVERSTDAASYAQVYSSAVASFVDQGLSACTTYYYRVRDFNGDGLPTAYDAPVTLRTGTTLPLPPGTLVAQDVNGGLVALTWQASPSASVTAYRLYMSTGALSYAAPWVVVPATATSYTTPVLSTTTVYRFGVRAYSQCAAADDGNTNVIAAATPLLDTSGVSAAIKVPDSGKKVRGNRVTVMAAIVSGDPNRVRDVRFQYRTAASTFAAFADIPAADVQHPNPAPSAPYFIHWDVTSLPNGSYELRAVAELTDSTVDPAPPSVVIGVDAVNPDTDETVVGGSQKKTETVYNGAARSVGTADSASGAVVEVALPAGCVSSSTDTLSVQVNPAGAPLPDKSLASVGQNIQITLGSGQTSLNGAASIVMHYVDTNGDGVIAGTSFKVDKVAIYSYNVPTGQWRKESNTVVDRTAKTLTATTPHFSLFGLFAVSSPDLSTIQVYPVPWVPNDGDPNNGKPFSAGDPTSGIVFDNLTDSVRIQVFSASGSLVWDYSNPSTGGRVQWDGRNMAGRDAASGGYVAVITDRTGGGKAVRKIAIIR